MIVVKAGTLVYNGETNETKLHGWHFDTQGGDGDVMKAARCALDYIKEHMMEPSPFAAVEQGEIK